MCYLFYAQPIGLFYRDTEKGAESNFTHYVRNSFS